MFCVAVATSVLLSVASALAQQGYKKPPKEVLDILHAPTTPGVSISPTRDNIILSTAIDIHPSPIWRSRCCGSADLASTQRQTPPSAFNIQSA
jgi:hypothetical protein